MKVNSNWTLGKDKENWLKKMELLSRVYFKTINLLAKLKLILHQEIIMKVK